MVRAVLLALLLVVALPVGTSGAQLGGQSATAPAAVDIALLTLNGSTRAGVTTASMDVATAMAVQHDAGTARLDRYTLEERFGNTGSADARKRLLAESGTAVESRISSLSDEERALRAAYAAREIDAATFVRRLARLDARVSGLQARLDGIQELADDVPAFSIRPQIRPLEAGLFGYEGPVRGRALAAMQGDVPPTRLYVAASESGVVASTIQDGHFVREAYRGDHRDPEAVTSISINEANELAEQLYPESYNASRSIRTGISGLSGGSLYRIDIELRQGVITAYLDGASRTVFFETQERRLDLLGPRPAIVGEANGTRLVVNRSFPGGPLRVSVTDNATGAPRETTVVVDGDRLETAADGTRWTLAPAGPFEVTAVGPEGNVTVKVLPLSPTTMNEAG